MALANFFDKAALAASQILQGYNKEDFEKRLMAVPVELAFDQRAVKSNEGLATLDLTVRLLSRLYPKLIFKPLDADSESYRKQLEQLAKEINPLIEFTEELAFVTVAVGDTVVHRDGKVFYIGSHEWTVHFSVNHVVETGNSQNPFAAGAAACFGVANVFRAVFRAQLKNGDADEDFTLSLLNFERTVPEGACSIDKLQVTFNEAFLVGLGAIGNGTLWALSRLNHLKGSLYVIDHERIELSNLQRYVLTTQEDREKDKITICEKFNQAGVFKPFKGDWASFLAKRQNWDLTLVALAVDSAKDRISIQASLPQYVLNAWTQPSDLGISRHFDFINNACVACLYPPRKGGQSKSQLIAGALGLQERELDIRTLVYNDSPLDEGWIKKIAEAKQVSFEMLEPYIGLPICVFYGKVLCGGLITTNGMNQQMETPMAFQSALAGILLASELVLHTTGIRTTTFETMTRINLLQPLAQYLNEPLQKTAGKSCICHDKEFKLQYNTKYNFDAELESLVA